MGFNAGTGAAVGAAAGSVVPGIGTAIGAGVGALGGVVSSLFQNRSQKKQQDKAFSHDKEMWNLANHYNSPEMQMQRLEAAGLNKNLVYGKGTVAGNTSTQTPKYQAAGLQRLPLEQINPLQVLGSFADLKQKNAEATKAYKEAQWIDKQISTDIILKTHENIMRENLTGRNLQWNPKMKRGLIGSTSQNPNLHLMKTQADYQDRINRNQLQKLDLESYKHIPKEWRWLLPIAKSFLPSY